MENELVVIRISDLKALIKDCMKEELAKSIAAFAAPDDILNTDDLTKLLKISKGYAIKLRKMGLPFHRLGVGSGAVRYKRNAVLDWVKTMK
jgi:hypothetical protein